MVAEMKEMMTELVAVAAAAEEEVLADLLERPRRLGAFAVAAVVAVVELPGCAVASVGVFVELDLTSLASVDIEGNFLHHCLASLVVDLEIAAIEAFAVFVAFVAFVEFAAFVEFEAVAEFVGNSAERETEGIEDVVAVAAFAVA
jgi:hypothetical protein